MIDQKKLKELIKLMVANDLTELDIQGKAERVTLKRGNNPQTGPWPAPTMVPPTEASHPTSQNTNQPTGLDAKDDPDLAPILCPMVGTIYAAASPDDKPFVSVGDVVDTDTVVCIIEAMKVFNEIKAETTGIIQKVMVKNGQAVEFNQPLFMVKTGAGSG